MGHYTIYTYNSLDQIAKQRLYDCNETPGDEEDDFTVRQIRTIYDNLGNVIRQAVMADPASNATVQVGVDAITDFVYDSDSGLLSQVKPTMAKEERLRLPLLNMMRLAERLRRPIGGNQRSSLIAPF